MSRERQEQIVDAGQYVFGGTLFLGIAAVTSAVMLIGFVAIEGIDRLLHHWPASPPARGRCARSWRLGSGPPS